MKKFVKILSVLIVLALFVGVFFIFGTHSDGVRTGNLEKFTKKGILFKTYEGEMSLGTKDNKSANESKFAFTVNINDQALADSISAADGDIKIFYKEKYVHLPWRGDTKYFVYQIKNLD